MLRFILALLICTSASGKPRAREWGLPFSGVTGPHNAITDVPGVEVGFATLNRGSGPLQVGKGPVRTGVTALLPRGKASYDPVFAGWFSQNGNGEMTGTTWIEESGFMEGPLMITNTHSVGVVHSATTAWRVRQGTPEKAISLPVVAETWDGHLNDINGFHVKEADVFRALDEAKGGPVAEGNVGSGMGMICYEFKCGIGTASRLVPTESGKFTLGVLVQANHGLRHQLRLAGFPVGEQLKENLVYSKESGSIIVAVATDAPLLPHQLKRLARRATMGLARSGSVSGDGSGDIFLAFSTANPNLYGAKKISSLRMLPNEQMDALFAAVVEATDEAIVNSLVAGETVSGAGPKPVVALPRDPVVRILEAHRLLTPRK